MIDISDSDIFIDNLDFEELAEYGLETWNLFGMFPEPDLMLDLVSAHPELHMVSRIGERFYNRYIPTADQFGVAKGDPNPEYEWVYKPLTGKMIRETYEALKAEPDRNFPGESAIFAEAFFKMFRNILSETSPLEGVVSAERRAEVREEWLAKKSEKPT